MVKNLCCFFSIGSDVDLMMIQSFLYSESIPSFCLNQHGSRILGGWNTINPIKIELYILKSDFESAKELLLKFVREYRGTLRLYDPNGKELPIDITQNNKEDSTDLQKETVENSETKKKYWLYFLISFLIVGIFIFASL